MTAGSVYQNSLQKTPSVKTEHSEADVEEMWQRHSGKGAASDMSGAMPTTWFEVRSLDGKLL
jgi:hypothetical protein